MRSRTFPCHLALGLVPAALAIACVKKDPSSALRSNEPPAALPAPKGVGEAGMSEPYKALRKAILDLKSDDVAGLDRVLEDWVAKLPTLKEADARFAVAQLGVLRSLRSIVFLSNAIVEKQDSRITHNSGLTLVRGAAAGLRVFLPDSPAELAFRYLVTPSREVGMQYTSVSALQRGLYEKLVGGGNGSLATLLTTLQELSGTVSDDTPIVWDNRLAFGGNAYEAKADGRYERVGGAELKAVLAATHMALHDVLVFCSFNLESAPQWADKVGKRFGLDGLFTGNIHGLPAAQLLEGLTPNPAPQFAELFKLLPQGPENLKTAYEQHLKPAVQLAREVYEATKNRSAERALFVKSRVGADWWPQSDAAVANLEALVKGLVTLKSNVTDETATFNLPAFYLTPPQDLKALLPKKFDTEQAEKLAVDGISYRNYWWGRPSEWDYGQVTRYVPSVSGRADVERAGRVLGHAVGAGINNIPLVALVPGQAQ